MTSTAASPQQALTILVTGANGGLARSVSDRLTMETNTVWLVRQGTINRLDKRPQIFDSVDTLLSVIPQIDAVLHLAARIPKNDEHEVTDLLAVNVDLVSKLVQALPLARHVLASSVSVYDLTVNNPLRIDSLPNPTSAYGWSKLAAECLVRQCSNHAVIRFSSLIGRNGRSTTFVPRIATAAQHGRITLYGDGCRKQNYVDLDDAADMCLRALRSNINFTTLGVADRSYTNNEVAEMLSELTGATICYSGVDESPSSTYDRTGAVDLGPLRIPLNVTLKNLLSA